LFQVQNIRDRMDAIGW